MNLKLCIFGSTLIKHIKKDMCAMPHGICWTNINWCWLLLMAKMWMCHSIFGPNIVMSSPHLIERTLLAPSKVPPKTNYWYVLLRWLPVLWLEYTNKLISLSLFWLFSRSLTLYSSFATKWIFVPMSCVAVFRDSWLGFISFTCTSYSLGAHIGNRKPFVFGIFMMFV